MVKLYYIAFFKKLEGQEPIRLGNICDVSHVNYFLQGTVADGINFLARTTSHSTTPGERTITPVNVEKQSYLLYAHAFIDGLVCVVVTDNEYPKVTVLDIIASQTAVFRKNVKVSEIKEDAKINLSYMKEYLTKSPKEISKIEKINEQLEEVKEIMRKNIDEITMRGEKLEVLMEKSKDLSENSKLFAKKSRQLNSCCKSW